MQRSATRIVCAFLLMAIALTSSVGLMVFAENETEPMENSTPSIPTAQKSAEVDLVLVRMLFNAAAGIHEIRICRQDGAAVQTLTPDAEGAAVSNPMVPGEYLAITELGRAAFTLHENAAVSVQSGCGWSDGEQLYLTHAAVGSVTVRRRVAAGELLEEDGWLDYTLSNSAYYARQVVRQETDTDAVLECVFQGVPYGSYVLHENGVDCGEVILTAAGSNVTLLLP